jgi:hypothetical protein
MKKQNLLKSAFVAAIIILTANYTFTQNQYISALTGKDIVFKTGNTERMRITSDGQIGISGALTTGAFNVTGATSFDSLHVQNRIKVGGSIYIDNYNGTPPGTYHNNHIYTNGTGDPTLYIQSNWGDNPSNSGATNNFNTIINFDNYGKVGIGTNNPQEKLEVDGYGKFGNTNGYVKEGFNTAHAIIDANQDLLINYYSGKDVYIGTGTTKADVYMGKDLFVNGNVGIGTISPTSKLHTVASGVKTVDYTGNLFSNLATNTTISSITKVGVEIISTGDWTYKDNTNIGLYVSSVTGGDNNYDAIFNGGGNVGIGTISPTAKLHVEGNTLITGNVTIGSGVKIYPNGNIWASTEVKVAVTNPWPDFVFDEEYNLKTLNELEKYIKENKHLPNVPSAKEIEKEGVSLGEMSNTLLQKIEESILYIIELKKQNDTLQQENNEIKARISKLEAR